MTENHDKSSDFEVRTYQDFAALDVSTPRFEGLVRQVAEKVQNHDIEFYNIMVAHYVSIIPAMLHCKVKSKTRGLLPIGNYSICLADSGFGKGYAKWILETHVFNRFFDGFNAAMDNSFELNVGTDAYNLSVATGLDAAQIEERIRKEYEGSGSYVLTFDAGTAPAMKQLRHKILSAHLGSVNFIQDEVGSNIVNSREEMPVMLELYDTGDLKEKLVKNTKENQRYIQKRGSTPTTMLLFGTPKMVFDGGRTESTFISDLTAGFARRTLFAWGLSSAKDVKLSKAKIEEMYSRLTRASDMKVWDAISKEVAQFLDKNFHHREILLTEQGEKILLNYKFACEQEAKTINEFADLLRTELIHRHSKVLKLAGALAFWEYHQEITEDDLLAAISIVEQSGRAFDKIINRERSYATLARFLAAQKTPVTLADISESLPFFKTAWSARKEQLELAGAWGRRHFITIQEEKVDGISMYQGFALEQTNLSNLVVSASINQATGYEPLSLDWNQGRVGTLLKLTNHELMGSTDGTRSAVSWCPVLFKDGHRKTENAIPGFNLIVLDIDGTTTLESVHDILAGYHFATCTTKSHTADSHRFRVVIPMNVRLTLDENAYRAFMQNIMDWLPFKADTMSCSIAHKWLTNPDGEVFINQAEDIKLFDAFPFIPGTRHNELRLEEMREGRRDIASEAQLIYWFIKQINEHGNRNNHLFRLGVMLAERTSLELKKIYEILLAVNDRIKSPLGADEVRQIAKGLQSRWERFKAIRKRREALEEEQKTVATEDNVVVEDIPYGSEDEAYGSKGW